MIEYTADQLLTPLKAEFEREYGLVAEWVYIAEEDSYGVKTLQIRLNVPQDFEMEPDHIGQIVDRIRDVFDHDERTAPWFPFVLFNLAHPVDMEEELEA